MYGFYLPSLQHCYLHRILSLVSTITTKILYWFYCEIYTHFCKYKIEIVFYMNLPQKTTRWEHEKTAQPLEVDEHVLQCFFHT